VKNLAKYVLVSDPTLTHEAPWYAQFLSQRILYTPAKFLPAWTYDVAAGSHHHEDGRERLAPYGLRKVEASLLSRYNPDEVVVAHPDYAEKFIGEDTRIVGIYSMSTGSLTPEIMIYNNGRTVMSTQEYLFSRFMLKMHGSRMKRNPRAKIVIGGGSSWELSNISSLVSGLHIDHVVQGEIDDATADLFDSLSEDNLDDRFTYGYQSFDAQSRKIWLGDPSHTFVTRAPFKRPFPLLSEIPLIRGPTARGVIEVMRGCGIGCDFCEVTLRPSRYYAPETVAKEIQVNLNAGVKTAWFQSDDIFVYQHARNFEPNEDALATLFKTIMATGVIHANPTCGRISVPAAYPDLIRKLSEILHAGPDNWIVIIMGIETGSGELVQKHMRNKALPLQIGADGTWSDIVFEAIKNLNANYWRPACTVQIGQESETEDDNWMTVGLINDLSNANFSFTLAPLLNSPLGLLKTRLKFHTVFDQLDEAQASVIYACARHMQKMGTRYVASVTGTNPAARTFLPRIVDGTVGAFTKFLELTFRRRGFSMEKAKTHSLKGT
jgi:radical SAM superfamily enzyme YgiQ (UPF0313 family)